MLTSNKQLVDVSPLLLKRFRPLTLDEKKRLGEEEETLRLQREADLVKAASKRARKPPSGAEQPIPNAVAMLSTSARQASTPSTVATTPHRMKREPSKPLLTSFITDPQAQKAFFLAIKPLIKKSEDLWKEEEAAHEAKEMAKREEDKKRGDAERERLRAGGATEEDIAKHKENEEKRFAAEDALYAGEAKTRFDAETPERQVERLWDYITSDEYIAKVQEGEGFNTDGVIKSLPGGNYNTLFANVEQDFDALIAQKLVAAPPSSAGDVSAFWNELTDVCDYLRGTVFSSVQAKCREIIRTAHQLRLSQTVMIFNTVLAVIMDISQLKITGGAEQTPIRMLEKLKTKTLTGGGGKKAMELFVAMAKYCYVGTDSLEAILARLPAKPQGIHAFIENAYSTLDLEKVPRYNKFASSTDKANDTKLDRFLSELRTRLTAFLRRMCLFATELQRMVEEVDLYVSAYPEDAAETKKFPESPLTQYRAIGAEMTTLKIDQTLKKEFGEEGIDGEKDFPARRGAFIQNICHTVKPVPVIYPSADSDVSDIDELDFFPDF